MEPGTAAAGPAMCGHAGAAGLAGFLAMWTTMMAAMMLPSLLPALWRRRADFGPSGEAWRVGQLAVCGLGYAMVWAAAGLPVYALKVALGLVAAAHPALADAGPVSAGLVVLGAGLFQFSPAKAHRLEGWREPASDAPVRGIVGALLRGLQLGAACCGGCAGLTAALLAVGIMDLRAMAAVTAAITLERLAPARWRVAEAVGAIGLIAGFGLIARATL